MNDNRPPPTRFSPEELGRLLSAHVGRLVLYARGLCDAPEDVVQEAFIELAAASPPPQNTVAWLFRVVRNRALTASRTAGRRKKHEAAAADLRGSWFTPSVDSAVDGAAATAALQNLASAERETVVLRIWGDHTFAEIAALTGVSDSTAQRRFEAGLATLRERLHESCSSNTKTRI